jgi:hypothetical protein
MGDKVDFYRTRTENMKKLRFDQILRNRMKNSIFEPSLVLCLFEEASSLHERSMEASVQEAGMRRMLSLGMSALGSALTGFSSVPLDLTFARFGLAGLDRGSQPLSQFVT